jgi:hypothetical protein
MTQVCQAAEDNSNSDASLKNPSAWLEKRISFGHIALGPTTRPAVVKSVPVARWGTKKSRRPWLIQALLFPLLMALPASDAFTDVNGTQLTAHSASWTLNFEDFDIQSNALAPDAPSGYVDALAHWNADAFNNDQYAQAVFVSAGSADRCAGVAVRVAAASTDTGYLWYSATAVGSASYLGKYVAGSWTQLGSNGAKWSNGDTCRLEASGTTITPKINGSTLNPPNAQTDSAIASGYAGVSGYGDSTTNKIDDWEGGNLVTQVQPPRSMHQFRMRQA